jgi:formate hydrogenlyase transcriptional activator
MSIESIADESKECGMAAQTNWASEGPEVNHIASFEIDDATSGEVALDHNELRGDELPRIIGNSTALRHVLSLVRVVAPTNATVLINGETGTGKELIAEAIHKCSGRSEGPFVKVNCAAIPAGLLESELFGHERGAYTGAVTRGIGRFERASRGTLFLDEIGDLPLELQPKLLRVIQEKQFERLGGAATIHTDVRVICATHRNLVDMVDERQFRADLFYRLSVFPIELPPLRDRLEDIRLLVHHFAMDYAARLRKRITAISEEFMVRLARHTWPGNVRELQNFIERSVILSSGGVLTGTLPEVNHTRRDDSNASTYGTLEQGARLHSSNPLQGTRCAIGVQSGAAGRTSLRTLTEVEREHISEIMEITNGLIAGKGGAAEILGLNASTLRSRMKKLGIRPKGRASSPRLLCSNLLLGKHPLR